MCKDQTGFCWHIWGCKDKSACALKLTLLTPNEIVMTTTCVTAIAVKIKSSHAAATSGLCQPTPNFSARPIPAKYSPRPYTEDGKIFLQIYISLKNTLCKIARDLEVHNFFELWFCFWLIVNKSGLGRHPRYIHFIQPNLFGGKLNPMDVSTHIWRISYNLTITQKLWVSALKKYDSFANIGGNIYGIALYYMVLYVKWDDFCPWVALIL